MAHVISIYEQDVKYDFQPRQVPIEVDDMKMVVQFSDKCVDCEKLSGVKQKDMDYFTNKFYTLSKDEVAKALLVLGKDIVGMLSHMVPCVSCRKSVERLFYQLQKSQNPALEPLVITPRGEMSILQEYLANPRLLFSLFHVHGSKLHSVVEATSKGKKTKRCNLHSLETHKARTMGCWLDAWDTLSESCKEKVLVVDMNQLLSTIDTYLEKHKFCAECKSKVVMAYDILVGEHESSSEKGYCAALYENLRCCAKKRHVHVLNDTEFIAHLLEKAEPDFIGGKRDRHAKTLDVAQEEVLTCLGIHIFERLHRIWQKLRSEEQTWLILFYMGVDALRKSYQTALEEKQGASNLELLCEEFQENEKKQEVKKELKRQKKKQKKAKSQVDNAKSCSQILGEEVSCKCPRMGAGNVSKTSCNNNHQHHHSNRSFCNDSNFNTLTLSLQGCDLNLQSRQGSGHDPGLTSLAQSECHCCESCCMLASSDKSEESKCSSYCTDNVDSCQCDMLRTSVRKVNHNQSHLSSVCHKPAFQTGEQPSLQELLDELCWVDDGDDDPGISEEEILAFKAKHVEVDSKRQKLRQSLRQRFEELHLSARHVSTV